MNYKKATQLLKELDNGKFSNLINSIELKDDCFNCRFFSKSFVNEYPCKIPPNCIGATIEKSLRYYFIWKLNIITKEQYFKFLISIGELTDTKSKTRSFLLPIGLKRK